jgi:hypothetical protein
MKYKTFRFLVISGIAVGGIGTCALLGSSREPEPAPVVQAPVERPAVQPAPTPAAAPMPADYRGFLLSRLGQQATGDKLKDAFPGPAKVNVYAKNGVWDRAKVDLNRDDKWDEKWWVKGATILRETSTDDGDSHGKGTVEGMVAAP